MTRYAAVVVVGCLAGAATAADPDPAALTVPPHELARAADLVRLLGSEEFADRERAEADLAKMGRAAVAALRAGTGDASAEVRARCLRLRPRAERLEFQARLDTFLADTGGKYEHDFAGWTPLRVIARGEFTALGFPVATRPALGRAAREVFVELVRSEANRRVLAGLDGRGRADARGRLRYDELAREWQDRLSARERGTAAGGGPARGPSPADALTLLLVEAATGVNLSAQNAGGPAVNLVTASDIAPVLAASGDRAEVYRAVFAAWCDSRRDPDDQLRAMHTAGNLRLFDLSAAAAARVLANTDALPEARVLAASTLLRVGTKGHAAALEPGMGDATVIVPVWRAKQFSVQARDVHLVVAVLLTKQDPAEYGFLDRYAGTGRDRADFHYARYGLPDDARAAAFAKWKAWRAKNP